MYLVGSAALGDFQPGRSDIDTITVIADSLSVTAHQALQEVHAALSGTFAGIHYDTTYIPVAWLSSPPPPRSVTPHSQDGVLRIDQPSGQIHPVQWIELAEHGVRIAGPDISDLPIAIDRPAADTYVRGNLAGYWGSQAGAVRAALDQRQATDSEALANAATWLILGPPRLAAFLESGSIISKSAAAGWIATHYPELGDLSQRCLAHRRGLPATFTQHDLRIAADLIEDLIRIYALPA